MICISSGTKLVIPLVQFFGFVTEGLYQSDADAAKGPTYKGAAAGSFIYKDVNGDGVIDHNDRTWIGNPNPNFTYGINLNASYKGFDFTMILYGSAGNKDFNYVKYWTDFYSTFQGGKDLDLYNKAAIVQGGSCNKSRCNITGRILFTGHGLKYDQ